MACNRCVPVDQSALAFGLVGGYLINLSFKLKDQFFLDKNNTEKDKLCLI